MRGELIQTFTEDGPTLYGFFAAPSTGQGSRSGVLHIHDLYGAFYAVPYLPDLAQGLEGTVIALLSANIRYDIPANGQPDIAAWLAWLASHGYSHVVLVGHGLGASKVADYVMSTGDKRVVGVAFVSPPDQPALTHRLGQRLDEAMAWALLMLEAGQADELVRVEGLGPLSARAVRDLFGLRGAFGRFNYAERTHDWGWLARVRVPLLVLHTDADDLSRPAADIAKIIQRHATAAPTITTQIVAADTLGAAIAAWATGIM